MTDRKCHDLVFVTDANGLTRYPVLLKFQLFFVALPFIHWNTIWMWLLYNNRGYPVNCTGFVGSTHWLKNKRNETINARIFFRNFVNKLYNETLKVNDTSSVSYIGVWKTYRTRVLPPFPFHCVINCCKINATL